MANGGTAPRVDRGRLLMVPFAVLVITEDVIKLARHAPGGPAGALHWLSVSASIAFYALFAWSYLSRGPAVSTSRSAIANSAAVVGTFIPLTLPMFSGSSPPAGWQAVGKVIALAGIAWAVWSLAFLRRNLSIIAQARGVVDRGPYRWVRHPLYAGEVVFSLGIAITAWSPAAAVLWVAFCAIQASRARREERVLLGALPGYQAYRARTAALIPGLFLPGDSLRLCSLAVTGIRGQGWH